MIAAGRRCARRRRFSPEPRDSGQSWQLISPDLDLYLRELAILRDGTIVATGELGGILRSTDGGTTWQAVHVAYPNVNTPPNLRSLVVSPRDGHADRRRARQEPSSARTIAAAIGRSPIGRRSRRKKRFRGSCSIPAGMTPPSSKHGARCTSPVTADADGSARRFRPIASSGTGLCSNANASCLWRVSAAWQRSARMLAQPGCQSTPKRARTCSEAFPTRVGHLFFLVGQNGTLLRSPDAGKTWRSIPSATDHNLRRMFRDPRTGALVSFGEHGAIVRSEDAGMSWRPASSGTGGELRKGLIESGSGNLIIVGQQGAILRSADAGRTWHPLPSHTERHFRSAGFR